MKTQLKATFKVLNTNSKGEVSIGLVLKGELTDEQILSLHRLKITGTVFVDLYDGQASIEDYDHDEEERLHKGISYTLKDGSVEVADNQITIDEVVGKVETTLGERYELYVNNVLDDVGGVPLTFEEWLEWRKDYLPLEVDERGDIINNDGEPSEDEQEIESMRSEAEDEEKPVVRAPRVTKKQKEAAVEAAALEAAAAKQQELDDDLPF